MELTVDHVTRYRFDPPMRGVVQSHRLTPVNSASQTVHAWSISVDGATSGGRFRDGAGDVISTISLRGPVEEVVVHVTGRVVTHDTAGVLLDHRERIRPAVYLATSHLTAPDAALAELAQEVRAEAGDDLLGFAHALNRAIRAAIDYVPGQTHSGTTGAEALAAGRGVCQDYAHALIGAAVSAGLPARYVTGYLHSGSGAAAADASHAWTEIHIPDLGWVGFDASNGVSPDENYIRIGSGADAIEAAPIRGVTQGLGEERMDIDVSVTAGAQ